ncbi:MAG: BrnT family toxin [Pseudomonadota bacterium]
MKISYDQNKRLATLKDRGLDFEDAIIVFAGDTIEMVDKRKDYGEERIICYGWLQERMVVIGYVKRGDKRHIFSMRKANDRERKKITQRFK